MDVDKFKSEMDVQHDSQFLRKKTLINTIFINALTPQRNKMEPP